MSSLYFHPYVPPHRDFDGTLVFANSHYRAPRCGKGRFGDGFYEIMSELAGTTASKSERERYWTQAQIHDVLRRPEEGQHSFYRRLRNVICPDRHVDVAECFKHVAFAVAVQKLLHCARAPRDLRSAGESFCATLDLVSPRRVLVLGMPVWTKLHGDNERFSLIEEGDGDIASYGDVWATWCYHPAAWQFNASLVEARRRFRTVAARTKRRG